MFSPEQNQISICLLKSNLEEIESDLNQQRSAWPELDAENEQKYRETLKILRVVRSLGVESEQLKQENVRLVARRMELKRQSDDVRKALDNARQTRADMENALKEEEQEMEHKIRRYEDSLREKADRLRQARGYYNEEEMRGEIAKVVDINTSLEAKMKERRAAVDELRRRLDGLQPDVPQDLLAIVGKQELDKRVESLTNKCEGLQQTLNDLKNKNSAKK